MKGQSPCNNLEALAPITSSATVVMASASPIHSPLAKLVVRLAVEDAQDGEEKVDDVEIQADCGGNLLLNMVVAHNHLSVDEDVAAEDEGSEASIDELAGRAIRKEHGHESEEDEAPQSAEEVGHP